LWLAVTTLPALDATAWVAVMLSTAAGILLTGAFHEDGLADTADGLGGGFTPERVLLIMKDSRLGTYGALGLFLVVLIKVALLVMWLEMSLAWALCVLLLAHTVSRFFPLCVIKTLNHVGDTTSSKSKPLASQISWRGLGVALLWCVPPFVTAHVWLPAMVILGGVVLSALCAAYMAWRLRVRIQGFTGDGLGAVQQLSEVGFYLGALCIIGLGAG
jgi:adenosylcobinamide-GDP ribazoletransferase